MVCSPSTKEGQDNIRLGHNIGQMDNFLEKKKLKIELKELVSMQKIGNDTSIERSVTSPGGVLGISSDGDDRRIFLGLKF